MKVAIIPSLDNVGLSARGDFDLVEAQWCREHFTYRRYYTMRSIDDGRYVIVDNGAALTDGPPSGAAYALDVARYMKPKELVAPDVVKHGVESYKRTMTFLIDVECQLMAGGTPYKTMVVPQGNNPAEWVSFYERLVNGIRTLGLDEHVTIGVPKWLTWHAVSRPEVLAGIDNVADHIEHHLLGGGRRLLPEVSEALEMPFIRGIDTSVPVSLAMVDMPLDENTEVPAQVFRIKDKLTNTKLAEENIDKLLEVAHGTIDVAESKPAEEEASASEVREVPSEGGKVRSRKKKTE